MKFNYLKNAATLAVMAIASATATKADVVANFPMNVDGSGITETITGNTFAIHGNMKPMEINSPRGKAWRTDGYTNYVNARMEDGVINGDRMSAQIIFAIDTHVIILQDNNDANQMMAPVATCLDEGAAKGFGFYVGRTGEFAFKVYVGRELVTLKGSSKLPLWEWTSLQGIVDGRDVKLYLNGELVAQRTVANAGVKVDKTDLIIGRDPMNNNEWCGARTSDFNGAIDELTISNDIDVVPFKAEYADLNLPTDRYASDRLRARFHGQPGMNWTNETHGLFYNENDGKYHVFFQRTGSTPVMSHAHWGQIVSDDLYTWRDEKPAISPSEDYDLRGCWSGCVFTDDEFNGGKPVILYTGVGYGPGESHAAMAYCDDAVNLRSWHKADRAIDTYSNTQRDTYFFRTDANNAYFVIGDEGCLKQYRWTGADWTPNGNFYTFQGDVEGGFTEMPNISQLPNGRWLMTVTPWNPANGVVCLYRIGDINSEGKFVNYTEVEKFDIFARDGYGVMSPSIGKDKNGNLIAMGIVADKMPTEFNLSHGYAHLYSLPRSLSVDSEGRLMQKPFAGYEAMRGDVKYQLSDEVIEGNVNLNPVRGRQAEICATFEVADDIFGFNFYKDAKGNTASVSYNPANKEVKLSFGRLRRLNNDGDYSAILPIAPEKGETMKLQLFIDHSIVDLFVNDRYAASVRIFPQDDNADLIELFAEGPTRVVNLEAYMLGEGDCSEKPVEPFVFKLPENSGRIGVISSINPSVQEAASLAFFTKELKAEVITTDNVSMLNADELDCVMLHIDRMNIEQGYKNLPDEYLTEEFLAALKQYVADGGNLILSGHATQMLVAIGRIAPAYAPNVFNAGAGAMGDDEWTVNTTFNGNDYSTLPMFANMEMSDAFEHATFGLLYGGGASILREDHNSMWNFSEILYQSTAGNLMARFEEDTYSRVIGTWGQIKNDEFGGIIEFFPATEDAGTIIANGLAACQWSVENGSNAYTNNLKLMTANIVAYLADSEGNKPYNPGNGNIVMPEEPEYEQLESTGRVALVIGYNSVEELLSSDSREEKAVYEYFISNFDADNVVTLSTLSDLSTLAFDVAWLHFDRMNITSGDRIHLPSELKSTELIEALNNFVAEGGNLYLSKHTGQLAIEMGRTDCDLNVASSGDGGMGNDIWRINIAHNNAGTENHAIFNDIDRVNYYGMDMIELLGNEAGLWREDHNALWNMNSYGGYREFCNRNNARVLATWGHNDGDAMWHAGLVEFLPAAKDVEVKSISQSIINRRKGTIIVNGFAACEWSAREGVNTKHENLKQLTHNILSYLSPVAKIELGGNESSSVGVVETESEGSVSAANGAINYEDFTLPAQLEAYTADGRCIISTTVFGNGSIQCNARGFVIVKVTTSNSGTISKLVVK